MEKQVKPSVGLQFFAAFFGAGLFLLICYFLGCFGKRTKTTQNLEISSFKKELIADEVKNSNIAIKDAAVTDVGYLYLAVIDDGIDKTAMANYYCKIANEKWFEISSVKIVDIMTFKKGNGFAEGKQLGISHCK